MSRPLQAVVFDLDGVLTRTARLHFASWKRLFEDLLHRPFEEEDYRRWVDGKPRIDGLRSYLGAQGVEVDARTLEALAARKQELFSELLAERGVEVVPGSEALLRALREEGVRAGMASSSKNADAIARRAGLRPLIDAEVDGVLSERLHLHGKPAPDIFLECLRALGPFPPVNAAVFEDAVCGIEAGRAGGFGLVVGVAAADRADRLREAGADQVVPNLEEVTVQRLREWMVRDG